MKNTLRFLIPIVLILLAIFILGTFIAHNNITILNPKGEIAIKERDLIFTMVSLMLVIVIPVFILTFFITTKYRENNTKSKYSPDSKANILHQIVWWAIPTTVILVMAIFNWNGTHALDPYKPIDSNVKPITIQVVALRWKWLFIYPKENIATINFIEFPTSTPVSFELTADAPMNSFWIPSLSGQIYAMSGMSTQLHLISKNSGEFIGSAAEINGSGFSGMKFVAKAGSKTDFDNWVKQIKKSSSPLDMRQYNALLKPSENNSRAFYYPVEKDLYNKIMMKFMLPPTDTMHMKMSH